MWPIDIPELATKRLRLRAPGPSDAVALMSILGDPEVTRYHNMPTLRHWPKRSPRSSGLRNAMLPGTRFAGRSSRLGTAR
jgi:RimJ/RimL family protein N-acetyltransferase